MSNKRDDALARLSARFDVRELDADAASIAVIETSGSILWVNRAWLAFGAANGADLAAIAPGRNYFDAAQGEVANWLVERVAASAASGVVVESDYECSSAEVERHFHMRILPVNDLGLILTHTLRRETSHEDGVSFPLSSIYRNDSDLFVMCSNCRHTRRRNEDVWDWVPSFLEHAPGPVSHGLCRVCLDFYYR